MISTSKSQHFEQLSPITIYVHAYAKLFRRSALVFKLILIFGRC